MRDTYLKAEFGLKQSTGCRGDTSRASIKWQPPVEDWMKVNTDGAVCNFLGIATIGGLIRDKVRIWRAGFTRKIGMCSSLVAEL